MKNKMKKNIVLTFALFCLLVNISFAQKDFKFTNKPSNEGCVMKGKNFSVEGNLVAEDKHSDGGKSLYFAIKKGEDALITYVGLNPEQEAKNVSYHFFTKAYLEDVQFGSFGDDLSLSIDNMYSKYKYDEFSEENVQKKTQEINGTMIRTFKTKKELETFKKMLKK